MEPLDFCHSILHQLPVEVITMILTHLRLKDLFNVALACKDLRSLVFDNNALWRVKCGQMLTVTHAKTHNGLSNNYSLSAYDQCRISFNWQRGCFREMLIARSTVKYMPWICLQPDILILSTGFTLSCIAKDNRSLPSWKQALWTLNVPKVTRRGVRTNDISRFVIKDNVIVCGNRDGCIAVYGHKTGSRTVQDFVSSAPVLRHHIKDCHEDGAAEVSAVDCSGRHGDMCIASTSSDCRIIKFWKQSCANLDAKDPSGRRTNANRSKYNKKSRSIFTCVRGVETTGGTGGKCLLMDASESRLAVGLNGSRMPLLVDIETGSALSNPIPMQNNRECVKDITWLNENMVVYVTHTGYLYCLDTRTKQIVYQSFDPLAASLYSVKTDGQHAIITGSSQSSRCTLYDSRSSKCCVQILFTQKCSSPVYSVDFDASTLAAAAERGVAILNFNVNSKFRSMSLLPFLFDYEVERPRRLQDQHFGLGLAPDDMLSLIGAAPRVSRDYYRPWRQLAAAARDVGSTIKSDKDKFQINLDVQHFAPEEISVKTVDGYVIVEGKHEEKKDEHGYVSRQFVRRYALPEGCVPESVQSKLSSDGVLSVVAPRTVPPQLAGERSVPIAQTGPVRKEVKDHANGDK